MRLIIHTRFFIFGAQYLSSSGTDRLSLDEEA